MGKIFYANKSDFTTEAALKKIFSAYYGKANITILRAKNGKPYVENGPHFSVTHTQNRLYLAFSDEEIGLDAEHLLRTSNYAPIVKKFAPMEQAEITSAKDFLTHWVVKESAVKYMGGTLTFDLKHLDYTNACLTYRQKIFPAKVTLLQHEGFILCVCGREDFKDAVFIPLNTL